MCDSERGGMERVGGGYSKSQKPTYEKIKQKIGVGRDLGIGVILPFRVGKDRVCLGLSDTHEEKEGGGGGGFIRAAIFHDLCSTVLLHRHMDCIITKHLVTCSFLLRIALPAADVQRNFKIKSMRYLL